MTSLLLLSLLTAAPTKATLERTVRDRFEAVGRSAPPVDEALSRAADELARRALARGVEEATGLLNVTAALSRQRTWDPDPTVVALRASIDHLGSDLATTDLASQPATHVGIGLALGQERGAVIILLARRRMELTEIPANQPKPVGAQRVCGRLPEPLTSAELFVTRPEGTVDRLDLAREGDQLCGRVDFRSKGRHAVEVLGRGPRGPEVTALFFVDIGTVRAEDDDALPEPPDDKSARAAVLERINALRLQLGLERVKADPALDAVAQAWAERLAKEYFFSHVGPDGSSLEKRLGAGGYAYVSAGENLGLSTGVLSAHFGIEHSPGHRRNLLEPRHRRLGLGLAKRSDGLKVLVEVLTEPLDQTEEKDPIGALYASIDAERKRKSLPPLKRNAVLESLAQAHARKALETDTPKSSIPGAPKVSEKAFEVMEELSSVAVDVMIAVSPTVGPESKNLAAASNSVVGAGLVKGDSPRFGPGRYWIVVVYGAIR